MCLIPRLSPEQVLRRLRVIEWALVVLMVYTSVGFIEAQPSQDYLNGQFAEQIRALNARMDRFDSMISYVLTGVFGTLGVTLWKTMLEFQRERRRKDDTT